MIREQQLVAREHQRSFELFGTTVRILAGGEPADGAPPPELAIAAAEAVLRACHLELSRFDPDSELSHLNADPEPSRVSSRLTVGAVAAAIHAAERSGGLVDPTLIGALEAAGYAESRRNATPAPLADALRVGAAAARGGSVARCAVADGLRRGAGDPAAAGRAARPRRDRQGFRRRPRGGVACRPGRLRGGRGRRHRPRRRGRDAAEGDRRASARRPPGARVRADGRRGGHQRSRHEDLADRRRASRTTCSTPSTGRPAWTGVDSGHRGRLDRSRGGDAGEDGPAARAGARAARARTLRAARSCWTTAAC